MHRQRGANRRDHEGREPDQDRQAQREAGNCAGARSVQAGIRVQSYC